MRMKTLAVVLSALLLPLSGQSALAGPKAKAGKELSKRDKAMAMLGKAMEILHGAGPGKATMKDFQRAVHLADQAVGMDPGLGVAHMVRGQFAVQVMDWGAAAKHFEAAIGLVDKPDQPLNPPGQVRGNKMTRTQVKGELHCSLGFVSVELGKRANQHKNVVEEQNHLERAHKHLKLGLTFEPSANTRQYAEQLLKAFAQVP